MALLSDYLENKLIDFLVRGQAFTAPTSVYVAMFRATAGVSPRSTAVTVGQTTVPATMNSRMYRCTTAGTTGASEPGTWPTTSGGTVTDGTAVWTEMSADAESNSANLTAVEVTGGSYARVAVASSLANWAGTQGAATTVASTGSSGTTSNNAAITFAAPTANWGSVVAIGIYDALTVGNLLMWGTLAIAKTVNNGDTAPSFAAATLSLQIDN